MCLERVSPFQSRVEAFEDSRQPRRAAADTRRMRNHHISRADSETDRRTELVARIDRKLDDLAGELSGLESRSDASNVNRALDHLNELEGLGDLKGKEVDDARARAIVDKYPAYARTFRDAAGHLVKLKEGQRSPIAVPTDAAPTKRISRRSSAAGLVSQTVTPKRRSRSCRRKGGHTE